MKTEPTLRQTLNTVEDRVEKLLELQTYVEGKLEDAVQLQKQLEGELQAIRKNLGQQKARQWNLNRLLREHQVKDVELNFKLKQMRDEVQQQNQG